MITREWVAIHRKHHAKCETAADPHSPQVFGINRVLWTGVFLYVRESRNADTLDGVPFDSSGSCNHLQEQMIPTEYWGTHYYAAHARRAAEEAQRRLVVLLQAEAVARHAPGRRVQSVQRQRLLRKPLLKT